MTPVLAGIDNTIHAKWQKVDKNLYLDTKDAYITKEEVHLWIKSPGYSKRRLIINCANLTEQERHLGNTSSINPIKAKSLKFKIANQLCFLTDVKGYSEERRKPNWAKLIINDKKKDL